MQNKTHSKNKILSISQKLAAKSQSQSLGHWEFLFFVFCEFYFLVLKFLFFV
jgi:hypothetical protein